MQLQQYEDLFLTESREYVSAVNHHLLALEQGKDDGDAVGAIFRAIHTIKGMSATMGYAAVAELSHELETVLDTVRTGARGVDRELLDVCFRSIDLLEMAIDAAVAGREGAVATAGVVGRLRSLTAAAPSSSMVGRVAIPEGKGIAVRVTLAPDTPLRGVRAFLIVNAARALGEVTAVSPPIDELELEHFDHELALRIVTRAPIAEIERVIRAAGDVESVEIGANGTNGTRGANRANNMGSGAADSIPLSPMTSSIEVLAADGDGFTTSVGGTASPGSRRHVRVDLRRLDSLMNLIGELVVARGRLQQCATTSGDQELGRSVKDASRLISELRDEITASRMVPAWQVFDRFPRVIRDLARALGKEVDFVVEGKDIELDRSMLDEIGDSLVHLLRNALDHGLETPPERLALGKPRAGRVRLTAARERSAAVIRVIDDGRGIDRTRVLARAKADGLVEPGVTELSDQDLFRLLTRPGFSTVDTVTDVSGRGVGFDAVYARVRGLGGAMDVRSIPGTGTTVMLRLPLTLAIVRAVLTRVGGETYAVPAAHVSETLELAPDAVQQVHGREVLRLRGDVLPLLRLRQLVGLPPRAERQGSELDLAIILDLGERRLGVAVDDLIGQDEIVVKPFDAVRDGLSIFGGATLLADGSPALIIDVSSLV